MVKQIVTTPDTLQQILESWFVRNVLLDGAPYAMGYGANPLRNSTVAHLDLIAVNADLIRQAKALGNKVVLFHMGDERADRDLSAYAECDLIVRNYYFAQVMDNPAWADKIIWAPNGYKTGVGPGVGLKTRPVHQRQCLAMFSGWLSNTQSFNNERALFIEAAEKCGDELFWRPSPGFSGGFQPGLYAALMEDSVFAPCPAGMSPETIRLYDALELGCIPVSLSHPFLLSKQALGALGPVPFPLLESWAQLPAFLADMKARFARDPGGIVDMQTECIGWWEDMKRYVHGQIAKHLREPEPQEASAPRGLSGLFKRKTA